MARKAPASFEDSLHELEQIVSEMENGNLSLDDALKHFEKGISLAAQSQKTLQKAELKVQQLIEKNGQLHAEPFHHSDDELL